MAGTGFSVRNTQILPVKSPAAAPVSQHRHSGAVPTGPVWGRPRN